ncbi:MAG: hypothetical protein ACKO1M_06305, partial [Planctomycetota bacterium]
MTLRPIPPVTGPRTWPLLLLVVGWLAVSSAPGSGADSVASPAAEARRLQAEFKRAKSAAERQAIAAGLLELDADGGRRLHAIARADFGKRLAKYSAGI